MTVENRWMIQLRSKIEQQKNDNNHLQFVFDGAVSRFSQDNSKQ